jgi:hypothetical protein
VPDRYLRDALLRSDRWNACSLDARDLYVRLVMIVDDYGCYDARDGVVCTAAYFLGRTEPLPLVELHACGLITRYTNAGKLFLALMRWGETLRGRRRYPAPPINNDLPGIKYRGKYGQKLNFANPVGSDNVSILIDVHGRPITPQPPEWRRTTSDWLPVAGEAAQALAPKDWQPLHADTDSNSAQSLPAVTSGPPAGSNSAQQAVSSQRSRVIDQESATPSSATNSAQSPSAQLLQPTTTPTTMKEKPNGEIRWQAGAWHGVSEAQRLRWQDMFAAISIPDQLDRAGAWLDAHPKEHEQIERDGSEHAFLVRWLLREVRPGTVPTRAKADA